MATVRWLGGATARKQIQTITIGGTWAANETITVTINYQDLILTIGSTTTTAQIATELAAAINAASATSPAPGTGYSRNFGGRELLEMTEFDAEAVGSTVVLTASTAGMPFDLTVAEASTSGTVSNITTVYATGPNHLNNEDNWEGGALPSGDDTLLFDSGAVDVKYGLDEFFNYSQSQPFIRTTDYTGTIGLPEDNPNGYREYRQRFLQFSDGGGGLSFRFKKGQASAFNIGNTYLDAAGQDVTGSLIVEAESLPNNASPSLHFNGGNFSTVYIAAGNVRMGVAGVTASLAAVTSSITTGRAGGQVTDCKVTWENATFVDCETLTQLSGEVHYRSNTNYTGGGTATWDHFGGVAYIWGGTNRTNLKIRGGSVKTMTGDVAAVYVYGPGEFSRNESIVLVSGAKVYLFAGAIYRDRSDNAADVQLYPVGCSLGECTLELAANKKYTAAAGAAVS